MSVVVVILLGLAVLVLIWAAGQFKTLGRTISQADSDEVRRMIDQAHG